jgi:hypothetical protein
VHRKTGAFEQRSYDLIVAQEAERH